jgi:hypothetical protein
VQHDLFGKAASTFPDHALVAPIRLSNGTNLGAFGAHRFLGKSPPSLGHFDQKCPMLGIISSARCLKAPG